MAIVFTPLTSIQGNPGGTTSYTTASLSTSPTAGSTLYIAVNICCSSFSLGTVSVADSHSNTFTAVVTESANSDFIGGGIYKFTYVSAPGTTTIKVTASGGIQYVQVTPVLVTGQGTSQTGAATLAFTAASATTTLEKPITTTMAGSRVLFGACTSSPSGASSPTVTPASGCTTLNNHYGSTWYQGITGDITAATVTPGSTTVGFTISSDTGDSDWYIYGLEILPVPPATSTAQFMPFFM